MRLSLFTLIVAIASLFGTWLLAAPQSPPVAPTKPYSQVWHGKKFTDPYYWLREKGSADVEKYLKDENSYAAAQTQELKPFEDALYKEMLARIKQDEVSAMTRDGQYYYYTRFETGKQYPIYCRKRAANDGTLPPTASEQVILDQNELGKGQTYISINNIRVSDDAKKVLYAVDVTGFRQYDLYLKDLDTGKTSAPLAQRVTSVEWASDNTHAFFVTEDAQTKRSDTLWRLKMGAAPEKVRYEEDAHFSVNIDRSKDKKLIKAVHRSTDTWDTWLLKSDQPTSDFVQVLPRLKAHKYEVEHRDGWLYMRTNEKAKNFRLVKAPLASPSRDKWQNVLAHRRNVLLDGFEVFQDFIAIQTTQAGLNHISIQRSNESDWKSIKFQDPAYTAYIAWNPEFNAKALRYDYQSFVMPKGVYTYDIASGESAIVKVEEVLGGYDSSLYASQRLWATSRDGKKIPISLVYKKGIAKDGKAPLWLYAYGSYGYGISPDFSKSRVSLLDRGVVFAVAHIRGGNEMGESWHDDGMLMRKKNTFNDYVDSALHLIKQKWTAKGRILAEGGSAGGLLMGAVTNMRPELFAAVHTHVPFVDVMNTMMDATIPLTVVEYLEWGNPNEKKAFDYMLSYSPYDNLARKNYPPILVTTSYNDSQVMYWEPAKYVAKLRTLKTDKNPLILKTKMEPAGHGGASGRFDKLRDTAFEFAWMLSQVGITK